MTCVQCGSEESRPVEVAFRIAEEEYPIRDFELCLRCEDVTKKGMQEIVKIFGAVLDRRMSRSD